MKREKVYLVWEKDIASASNGYKLLGVCGDLETALEYCEEEEDFYHDSTELFFKVEERTLYCGDEYRSDRLLKFRFCLGSCTKYIEASSLEEFKEKVKECFSSEQERFDNTCSFVAFGEKK